MSEPSETEPDDHQSPLSLHLLENEKDGGTSVEIGLSRFCNASDVITPIVPEDERIRAERGYRGPQNTSIPFQHYDKLDWLRLLRHRQRKRYFNHATADFVKKHIAQDIWDSYFKFCFERNPFDKAVSRYFWSTREPRPSIEHYLNAAPVKLLSDWDIYSINDHVAVNFVGRYENLQQDLAAIAERLSLPEIPELPRAKAQHRTDRKHYSEVLNPMARARIERACAKEMQAFGYEWDAAAQR